MFNLSSLFAPLFVVKEVLSPVEVQPENKKAKLDGTIVIEYQPGITLEYTHDSVEEALSRYNDIISSDRGA